VVTEFIAHDIPLDEMHEHAEQFVRFFYYGMFGIMEMSVVET
jgi:hypothetical protein